MKQTTASHTTYSRQRLTAANKQLISSTIAVTDDKNEAKWLNAFQVKQYQVLRQKLKITT